MDKQTKASLHGWSRKRRHRPLRSLLLLMSAGLLLALIWSTVIVLDARRRTPEVLDRIMASQAMPLTAQSFPPRYLDLLLAVQDPTFHDHHGANLLAAPGRTTTVTQALVKYLYFERYERGVINKIRQTLIAVFALDALTTKEQQLDLFVNTVYLGRVNGWQVRGFDQASQMYFGRDLTELDENEFLSLVAMLDAPSTFNLAVYPEANAQRVAQIRAALEKRRS
jgi:membrane carboxypeptidase/penicillin-binding protein